MFGEFATALTGYYSNWYNRKRIKLSLGGRSPLEYRQNLGLRHNLSNFLSAPPLAWLTGETGCGASCCPVCSGRKTG
ncbi:IS3 family transposase [Agathobaculum sp. LCP25S3_E8]|uniref:IS3 family transposase n=1 Tax=Agathobaculum sp. LCP25S3_E8 TaxID=3438735 RepID=UPI003F91D4BE